MAPTSPLQHLTTLAQQLEANEIDSDGALEHLARMRAMLTNMHQAVSMLLVPAGDPGTANDLKEASLAGIAGYSDALDLMEEYVHSRIPETAERALATAEEAEVLIKSLQRQAEDTIENYINP